MRKGQALLVFFATNLVYIMLFFIVLISVLTLTQNVRFVIRDFDAETAHILTVRKIVASADCLAYEDKTIFVDPKFNFLGVGARVFPNVIDKNKLYDYEYINCLRKDNYDLEVDVSKGIWDAAKGTGATQKYDIAVVDLSGDTPVFLTSSNLNSERLEDNIVTSLVGRVNKKIILCGTPSSGTAGDPCYMGLACVNFCDETLGEGCVTPVGYTSNPIFVESCIDAGCYKTCGNYYGALSSTCNSSSPGSSDSRCIGPDGSYAYVPPYSANCYYGSDDSYYDNLCSDYDKSCYTEAYTDNPANFYDGACVDDENKTSPTGIQPQWWINHTDYSTYDGGGSENSSLFIFYGATIADTSRADYRISLSSQLSTTCFDSKSPKRVVIPVSIYDNGELKPGAILIQTCLLEGEDHVGLTLPEIMYKLKYVKKT